MAKRFALGLKDLPRAILLLAIVAWVLVPFYFLFAVAFSPDATQIYGISIPKNLTLENFSGIFSGYNAIWHPLFNSTIITVSTTLLALLIAVPAAYALSHLRHLKTGRGLYLSFFVLRGIPSVSLVLPFFLIFSKMHLLNTLQGLIIALTPLALPYCVWILRVTFDSIPREIEEAASVDGAGALQTFGKVVLPIAAPGIAAAGILSALFTYVDYMIVSTLAGPSTYTFPVYITGFQEDFVTHVGPLSAAALIGALPMLLLFGFSQGFMRRNMAAGIH